MRRAREAHAEGALGVIEGARVEEVRADAEGVTVRADVGAGGGDAGDSSRVLRRRRRRE